MNQKGFIYVVLIVLIVVLASVLGYVVLRERETPSFQSSIDSQIPDEVNDESAIKFLSPKSGEQIHMDDKTYTIRWTTNNTLNKNKKVYLYVVGDTLSGSRTAYFIGTTDLGVGSYEWILPKDTDAIFGANFIDTNGPVKLAMAIYSSDTLPPNPLTRLRDLQTKPDIVYSGTISFKPVTVKARFVFPVGGERFTLGNPLVIKWELPTNIQVSDVVLTLNPTDSTKDINGIVHREYQLSNKIRSYTWNGKFMYIPVGPDFATVEVKPGMYYLHLGFRTTDGYYQGIDSNQFELISP